MRILLTGPNGQVGGALLETLPSLGEVVPMGRSRLDIADPVSIRTAVREMRPDVVVNAAAYTAVDQAENEEALAHRINAEGPAVLAEEAARLGALLVHFSTDYVFDGEKVAPYLETDPTNPLNAYGRSKLAGERAIQASGCRHLIFRTSWVYGPTGRNFMLTMLSLAQEGKPLRVVDDQRGAPTSSLAIAEATRQVLAQMSGQGPASGIYHMTAAGWTTWYGFARSIFEEAGMAPPICAIRSDQRKVPARRPRNSVLDNAKLAEHFGVRLPPWQAGLRDALKGAALAARR